MRDAVVLVFADKQDLSNAMTTTVVLQVIMEGLLGSQWREQVNLEWNTDLIETMKLKNRISHWYGKRISPRRWSSRT